jgi:hypothetical protein
MKWRGIPIAFAAFILIVGIFFYPTIFGGKLPVPTDALVGLYHPWRDLFVDTNPRGVPFKNFLITDPVRQQIPWRKLAIDEWKAGRIPSWNPYAFSGTTLSGNIQAAAWYPFNILFWIFSFDMAWSVLIIIQPLLAGVFMMLYLQNRKVSREAALVGGLSFAFSGFAISWLTWGTIVHAVLWLPLALLSVDLLIERKKKAAQWVLALALAMMVWAGHSQVALYSAIAVLAYFLWGIRGLKKGNKDALLSLGATALGFAALATFPVWFPFLRETLQSGRVLEQGKWLVAGWFVPVWHLVQFAAPDFFGNPATLNYWGTWNYGEMVGYIGMAPLLFALGVIVGKPKDWVKFWVWVGAVALVMAVANPLAKAPFFLNLPFISALQPTRLLSLVVFSLAVCAAVGFDAWQKSKVFGLWRPLAILGVVLSGMWVIALTGARFAPDFAERLAVAKRNLILPTVLFLATAGILLGRRKFAQTGRIATVALIVLIAADLLRFGWKFTPFTPREFFFPTTKVLEFLQNQPPPFRVMSLDDRIMPPNVAGYFGIESIEGYDPLYSSLYERFMVVAQRGKADLTKPFGLNRILILKDVTSPMVPLLNVKYVLTLENMTSPFLRFVMREGEVRVYEYTKALPRVFLAENIVEVFEAGDEAVLDRVLNREEDVTIVQAPLGILSAPLLSSESVRILSYSPSAMTIAVRAASPRLLVIQTPFDEFWRARTNGQKADIVRVNYLFFGVVVPQGENTVELTHGPGWY